MRKKLILLMMLLACIFAFSSCFTDDSEEQNGTDSTHDHSYGEWEETKSPTCTESGERERICSCGDKETEIIAKKEHSFGGWITKGNPSCIISGSKERTCYCGETETIVLNATGHTMEGNTCSVCGAKYSEGLEFVSNGNGTCYVAGIGTCTDVDLFIPPKSPDNDRVVLIGKYAFYNLDTLQSVVVGNNVESVDSNAFDDCDGLMYAVFPRNVISICEESFYRCTSLAQISFCERSIVTSINSYAFAFCESLSAIALPDSLTEIGFEAFGNCSGLKDVVLGNGVKNIYRYAFTNCTSLTNLVLGNSVKKISECAFSECKKLESVVFPDSLNVIEEEAFRRCEALVRVSFGEGSKLESIGVRAFEYCESLDSISIPNSTLNIGPSAFASCKNLKSVVIGNGVKKIENYAFANCSAMLSLVLGSNLEVIEENAFSECKKLESVIFPDSLKNINDDAFWRCEGLVSVSFGDGSKLERIGVRTFEHCESLERITIPNSVNLIETSAFASCVKLSSVVIGGGVKTIERYAFANCHTMTSLSLGNSLETICESAFTECQKIESVSFPDSLKNIDDDAFWHCSGITKITFREKGKLERIGVCAFGQCDDLVAVTVPDCVVEIGSGAFSGCNDLEDVILGKGVKRIGRDVFRDCPLMDRVYYNGSAEEWKNVDADHNCYPLSVTPYYYSVKAPTVSGNYWYLDKNSVPKVWDVTPDTFKPEFYSELYASTFFDTPSYATEFYNSLEDDSALKLAIGLWTGVHIAADPSSVFNPSDTVISQKDLYILTLHDLLMGNSVSGDKDVLFESFTAAMESAEVKALVSVAQALESYDGTQINLESIKDSIKNMSPKKAKEYLKNVCKGFSVEKATSSVKKTYSPDAFTYFNLVLSTVDNFYDAITITSKYEAMRMVGTEYLAVLLSIKEDVYAPDDLRNAAAELYAGYKAAFEHTLAQFQYGTFLQATGKDVVAWAVSATVDALINKVGFLQWINFMGKGLEAICEIIDMSDFVKSYYMLETAVMVEASIVRFVNETDKDYFRNDKKDIAKIYMAAIELYERSVVLGIGKSKEFLTAYINSTVTSDEEFQQYNELVITLTEKQKTSLELFDSFEDRSVSAYSKYYE